jgi:glycosyltransferase involved in cell wall biosynthesis
MIQWAGKKASQITTVCKALKNRLIELGVDASKIHVVLHGVDLKLFTPPSDRQATRERLGFTKKTLLSIGHLIERKGHHIPIQALTKLPEYQLVIIGDGEEEENLRGLSDSLGVNNRVQFLGHIDQTSLPQYFGAADALVLASSREGIANVINESLACGTPVIATNVWGAPEVITCPEAGVLMSDRSPEALVEAVHKLFNNYPDRVLTRRFSEQFTWENTTKDHLAVIDKIDSL